MSNSNDADNMSRQIWQSQPLEAPRVSLDYVQHLVENLNAALRREYYAVFAGAIAFVALLVWVFSLKPLIPFPDSFTLVLRLGTLLGLMGAGYLTFQVRRRGKVLQGREDNNVVESLTAYRTELQRRRDYCLGAWRWSLWPMAPSALVLIMGGILFDPRPGKLMRYGVVCLWAAVATLFTVLHQNRSGRKYQRELDVTDTLGKT